MRVFVVCTSLQTRGSSHSAAALVALGISYFLNKSGISLTLISVGIDYAQVISIFAQAKIPWPDYMLVLFRFFAAFSINLDLAAPG